jgi:hypothetical protein
MKKNKVKSIISVLIMSLLLSTTACSSSDDKKDTNDNKVTSSVTDDKGGSKDSDTSDNDSDKGEDDGVTNIGDAPMDLGDLDSETLTVYPEEKSPSMYFYSAKELSDEVFFPDQTELLGDPYYFNGTVLEEYDSIVDYLGLNEKHGQEIEKSDASAKSYKIMTKQGNVIVIDVAPYQVKYIKDSLDGNVMGLKYYKSWYNDLAVYKKLPELGDTGKFYGIYYGYSEKDECPVFTYGASELCRVGFFENDYMKYRSDNVKKAKYRNLITLEYPVGWSEPIDNGGQMEIYMPENSGMLLINDYEDADVSLDDAVKMLLGGGPQMPEDMSEEDMPEFNMDDYLKIHSTEKLTIGKNNDISAYMVDISVKNQNMQWVDETIYALKSKRNIVILEQSFYDTSEDGERHDTGNQAEEDLLLDEEGTSDGQAEDGAITGENLREICKKEFEKLIKSIELCGI